MSTTTSSMLVRGSRLAGLVLGVVLLAATTQAQHALNPTELERARVASTFYSVQPALVQSTADGVGFRILAPLTGDRLGVPCDLLSGTLLTSEYHGDETLVAMVRDGRAEPRTRVSGFVPLMAEIESESAAHTNEIQVAFGLRATCDNETITPLINLHFTDAAGKSIQSIALRFDPITLAHPGVCVVRSAPVDLASAGLDFSTPPGLQVEMIALDAGGELPIGSPRVFVLADAHPDMNLESPAGLALRGCPNADVMGLRVNEGFGNCVRAGDRITITLFRECMTYASEGYKTFLYFDNEDLIFDPNCSHYLYAPYGDWDPNFTPIAVSGPNNDEINLRAWIDEPNQIPTMYDADMAVLCFWVNENANGPTRVGFRQSPESWYIDRAGNEYRTYLGTNTNIYVDNTAPTLICPPDLNLQCIADVPNAATNLEDFLNPDLGGGAGTVTDASMGWDCALTLVHVGDSTSGNGCPVDPYIIERTYRATDFARNLSTCTQTITVIDDTPPQFDDPTFPANDEVECTAPNDPNAMGTPTGTDNCGGSVTPTYADTFEPACGNTGVITRTWTIRDECGNENSREQLITIVDTTDPNVITPPSDGGAECDGTGIEGQIQAWLDDHGGGRATDTCGEVIWSHDFAPANFVPSCGMAGYVVVTFMVKDECDNSEPADTPPVTFTIVDTMPPEVITPSLDGEAECNGTGIESQIQDWLDRHGDGEAIDLCGAVTWTNDFEPANFVSGCGMTGYVDVTFTVKDECDIAATPMTARFTITDHTSPDVNPEPAATTVECDSTGVANQIQEWLDNHGGGDAIDTCGNVIWSHNFDPNNFVTECGMAGYVDVTFTVKDECDNASPPYTARFTIDDTTGPTVDPLPSDETVNCDGSGLESQIADWLARHGDGEATDICGEVTWSHDFSPANFEPGCGMTGSIVVKFRAVDECGNPRDPNVYYPARFTIIDTTPPTIDTCPDEHYCNDPDTCTRSVPLTATASDACGDVTITYEINGQSITNPHTFPVGITTVTAIATDECDNADSCEFEVEITDCDAPAITCNENVTRDNYPGECGDIVVFNADATDNCTAAPDIIYQVESDPVGQPDIFDQVIHSPHFFPVGTNHVQAEAVDEAANFETCIFTVTVNDVEDPTFENCPADVMLETAPDLCTAVFTWTPPIAADNCALAQVTSTHEPGFAFPVGDTEVTYTAADIYGNIATCNFTVTVNDTQPPVLEDCPEDIEVALNVGQNFAIVTWTEPTASDNCGTSDPNADYEPGEAFPPGTTTVTYTTMDAAGNTASCSFDITVLAENKLWVNIELGPPEAMAPVTKRCITFQLWNCFFETWIDVDREIEFTNGQALNVLVYIPAGDYQCILARDKFHSLWQRDDYFAFQSGHYIASFTGDPRPAAATGWSAATSTRTTASTSSTSPPC